MKASVEALTASLREFIDQPDYPTLVLDATDSANVFPLKILAAFDRQDEENRGRPPVDGPPSVSRAL